MNILLIGLGVWCAASVPAALIIARLCGLNRTRSEITTADLIIEQAQTSKPPTPIKSEQQLRLT